MPLYNTIIITFLIAALVTGNIVKQNVDEKVELEKYIQEAKVKVNQRYRLAYHVAAPVGWINDPNGFSFYKGEYHLFYQYYPYDSVWGPMHWGHVTSFDLVHWRYRPTALLPGKEQCFSGSAIEVDNELVLMYTGHVVTDEEPFFNQSQYLAFSHDGVNFEKYDGNPVLPMTPNGNPDFRDPKVWKHLEYYYAVLGSKTDDNRGRVLLYRSTDMIEWEFLNVLAESDGKLGYMWECPDFFELDGKFVLLISPQGIEPEGDRYKNLFQTGYIVGNFNYNDFKFEPITEFQELDYGHDFYAAQTQSAFRRRLLISWFGMWEAEHAETADGWANAMTIVRELKLTKDNRIIQKPVLEMLLLRRKKLFDGVLATNEKFDCGNAVEIVIRANASEDIAISFEGNDGGGSVTLEYDSANELVILNRDGDIRQVEWSPKHVLFRIYLDTSSIEVFCGNGVAVFSSRVYPSGGWVVKNESGQNLLVKSYLLGKSIFV